MIRLSRTSIEPASADNSPFGKRYVPACSLTNSTKFGTSRAPW